MSIYDIKPAFQNLLRPITNNLAKNGVSANAVTIFALILSAIQGGLMWINDCANWTLILLPIVLFVRMALNAIDGMLAREHDMKTDVGAYLNELSDVASDTFLYLPFMLLFGVSKILIILIIITAIIGEMAGVLAWAINSQRRYDGPMGKSDRAFVFGAIALFFALGFIDTFWLNVPLLIILALSTLTIFNRCKKGLIS